MTMTDVTAGRLETEGVSSKKLVLVSIKVDHHSQVWRAKAARERGGREKGVVKLVNDSS